MIDEDNLKIKNMKLVFIEKNICFANKYIY